MRQNSSVDLIIPAYNSENTIALCLNSVKELNTDGINLNVLVVNNNSTDKTPFIAQDLGFNVIKCSKQGRACARNAGLNQTHSPFVAFVDSDVTLEKNWLQGLLPYLNAPCIGAVQSKVIPVSGDGLIDRYTYSFKDQLTDGTFVEMESLETSNPLLDTAACLYRREALEQVKGFNEELRYLEDMDLSIRLSAQGYSLRANLKVIAYKRADRNLFEFLIRTMHDAQDMFNYMATHSGKMSLRDFVRILAHPARREYRWQERAFYLLTRANNLFWKLGFTQSFFLHHLRPLPKKEIKIKVSKLNLLMKQVQLNDPAKKYVFSPQRRFFFSDRTLNIYGPNEDSFRRYQDREMLDFFKDYLDTPDCDFSSHYHAIERAINDQFLMPI